MPTTSRTRCGPPANAPKVKTRTSKSSPPSATFSKAPRPPSVSSVSATAAKRFSASASSRTKTAPRNPTPSSASSASRRPSPLSKRTTWTQRSVSANFSPLRALTRAKGTPTVPCACRRPRTKTALAHRCPHNTAPHKLEGCRVTSRWRMHGWIRILSVARYARRQCHAQTHNNLWIYHQGTKLGRGEGEEMRVD